MKALTIPDNLARLHIGEEELRSKSLELIERDSKLRLHVQLIEVAMDLADMFRQYETADEDLKVAQILGMRTFNAFGASLKLGLSGYSQNSALVMRDILETVFLLDLFQGDRTLIERWRMSDRKARMKEFSPVKVREALDSRDGYTLKRRAEIYELFSELAGHPTMKSDWMMRPSKDGDAVIGPFVEATTLQAVLSEMGRLAVQVGTALVAFFPNSWQQSLPARDSFILLKERWFETFYPGAQKATSNEIQR